MEKENKKNIDTPSKLTDYDVCDLYIRCVDVFVQTSSKLDIDRGVAFNYGKHLWKETIETLKEYRRSTP